MKSCLFIAVFVAVVVAGAVYAWDAEEPLDRMKIERHLQMLKGGR
jgi:hypothetical protein